MASTVFAALCNGAELYIYGGLSEKPAEISTRQSIFFLLSSDLTISGCLINSLFQYRDLIFKKKTVKGFWITDYLKQKYLVGLVQWSWTVQQYITTDFKTDFERFYNLTEVVDALADYSTSMKKVALKMS